MLPPGTSERARRANELLQIRTRRQACKYTQILTAGAREDTVQHLSPREVPIALAKRPKVTKYYRNLLLVINMNTRVCLQGNKSQFSVSS